MLDLDTFLYLRKAAYCAQDSKTTMDPAFLEHVTFAQKSTFVSSLKEVEDVLQMASEARAGLVNGKVSE